MNVKDGESTTRIIRSLRNGQVTIPAEFRRRLGIEDDSLLQVTLDKDELRIKPVQIRERAAGSPWLMELYEQFAPSRAEAARYSEAEINADIDQAIAQVRRESGPHA